MMCRHCCDLHLKPIRKSLKWHLYIRFLNLVLEVWLHLLLFGLWSLKGAGCRTKLNSYPQIAGIKWTEILA